MTSTEPIDGGGSTTAKQRRKGDVKKSVGRKEDGDSGRGRESRAAATKVVVRRLPPSMTETEFMEGVEPLADYDYFDFRPADPTLGSCGMSSASINFVREDDMFLFKDKFDGYVFVDRKGMEYPAIVELSPSQRIGRKSKARKDPKAGTIGNDPEFIAFVHDLENPTKTVKTVQQFIEDIDIKEKEMKVKETTPLLLYIREKALERQKSRDQRKEARRKREEEKRKAKEDERKKRLANKERELKEKKGKESGLNDDKEVTKKELFSSEKADDGKFVRSRGKKEELKILSRSGKANDPDDKERPKKREEEHTKQHRQKPKRDEIPKGKGREDSSPKRPSEGSEESESGKKGRNKSPQRKSSDTGGNSWKSKRYSDRRRDSERSTTTEEASGKKPEKDAKSSHPSDPPVDGLEANATGSKPEKTRVAAEKPDIMRKKSAEKRDNRKNKERPAMAIYRPGMGKFSSHTIKQGGEAPKGKQESLPQDSQQATKKERGDSYKASTQALLLQTPKPKWRDNTMKETGSENTAKKWGKGGGEQGATTMADASGYSSSDRPSGKSYSGRRRERQQQREERTGKSSSDVGD